MSEELKPCPFCGGKAELTKFDDDSWDVVCDNENCNRVVMTTLTHTKERAIELWNNRPFPWHTGTPIEEGLYICKVSVKGADPWYILRWEKGRWGLQHLKVTNFYLKNRYVKKWQKLED